MGGEKTDARAGLGKIATRIGVSCVAVSAPAAQLQIVDFNSPPVSLVLESILQDKTTKGNIFWTLNSGKPKPITRDFLAMNTGAIKARVEKARIEQSERTRKSAEVFTPSWVVNRMNNHLDEDWFGRKNVFNIETGHGWRRQGRKVRFESEDGWQAYVKSRRLEITCGEAPFIVSRYDAATGEIIPVKRRIGILDRKLRVVGENAKDEEEWRKWALIAFESVYGYEYQGDSLAIARANLVSTYEDYLEDRWGRKATTNELNTIANRVAWNFWQMDGFTGESTKWREVEQLMFAGFENAANDAPAQIVQTDFLLQQDEMLDDKKVREPEKMPSVIYDWRARVPVVYNDLKRTNGKKVSMKFDYIIGNPPYQEETVDTSDKPIYNSFMDGAYDVGEKVELITPARFLFNAGKTPKAWNEKMLSDPHLKVLDYTQKSSDVFANTDIKGGVAITYRDVTKEFGAIESYSTFAELNSILHKVVSSKGFATLEESFVLQNKWDLDALYASHPECRQDIGSEGKERRLTTSIFALHIFHDAEETGDVKILGLAFGNKRIFKYIKEKFLAPHKNLRKYKVIVPKSNGSGAIGEELSTPLIGEPLIGFTQSFISVGAFDNKIEAENCLKYIKTKFARTMLGILKITQDNPPEKWKYVPLQDFTEKSDIDWSKSIPEIDEQLYKKYGLDENEIRFIEEKVRAME